MSTQLVEEDVYTESVTVMEPGEAVTASSVIDGMQSVANRTRALRVRHSATFSAPGGGDVIHTFNTASWVVGASINVPNCVEGDTIRVECFVNYLVTTGTASGELRISATDDAFGTPEPTTLVGGGWMRAPVSSEIKQTTLVGSHIVQKDGTTTIALEGQVTNTGDATQIQTVHAFTLQRSHYRETA